MVAGILAEALASKAEDGGRGLSTPGRIRTCDPRFRKPVLYPPELRAHKRLSHSAEGFVHEA